jgi:hypothetical protein
VDLSLMSITEELFEWKSSRSWSRKQRLTAVGIRCAYQATPSIRKFSTNFADKRRSLGRYSSLADWSHGVLFSYSLVTRQYGLQGISNLSSVLSAFLCMIYSIRVTLTPLSSSACNY